MEGLFESNNPDGNSMMVCALVSLPSMWEELGLHDPRSSVCIVASWQPLNARELASFSYRYVILRFGGFFLNFLILKL